MKSVLGIGYYNGSISLPSKHPLNQRWVMMLHRCYNKNNPDYKYYGGNGVYVDERWHCFENYVEDISKKENYDKLIENPREWQIDKDKIAINKKKYSDETTIIIKKEENIQIRNDQHGNPARRTENNTRKICQYSLDGELINVFDTVVDASKSVNRSDNTVRDCAKRRQKTCAGYIWRYFGDTFI